MRRRTLGIVLTRRATVDYALQRRALLADVHGGRASLGEVCDAHPYLQRAATFHGDVTDTSCPVCRKDRLVSVHYIYGDKLGAASGQAKSSREIAAITAVRGEVRIYVVEVCPSCGWNHLTLSYSLVDEDHDESGDGTSTGLGPTAKPSRRQAGRK